MAIIQNGEDSMSKPKECLHLYIKGKVLGKSCSKVYIIVKICTDWLLSLTYNLGQNKKDCPRL